MTDMAMGCRLHGGRPFCAATGAEGQPHGLGVL